jgi:hypothetical protein
VSVQVREGTATTVRIKTDGTWTTPVLSIVDPTGGSVSGGSAALDSTSTTLLSAPTYPYQLPVTAVTGFVVGRFYKVTTDSVVSIVRVTRIETDTRILHVEPAPVITPESGDTIAGVEISVSVPAITPATGLGCGYQLVLTEDDREEREDLDVLPRLFLMDFRDVDLRRLLAESWPSYVMSETVIDGLVEDVREEIRAEMLARGVYPHYFISPSAFRMAGYAVARRLLAQWHNLYPPASAPDDYRREVESDISRYLARIQQSWQPRDTNDDGALDTDHFQSFIGRRRR